MSIDPSDPADIATLGERDQPELDIEVPEADAAEQHADLASGPGPNPVGSPQSADEGDRAEQAQTVELDEEEYRQPPPHEDGRG